jgi:hypothetical protein
MKAKFAQACIHGTSVAAAFEDQFEHMEDQLSGDILEVALTMPYAHIPIERLVA